MSGLVGKPKDGFSRGVFVLVYKYFFNGLRTIYMYTEYFKFSASTFEMRHEKTNVLVSTWSDTNQAVQLQKMARDLKFWI